MVSAINPESPRQENRADVWHKVRADVEAGACLLDFSRRNGILLGTVRNRSARGRWSSADMPRARQPLPPANPAPEGKQPLASMTLRVGREAGRKPGGAARQG